MPEQLSVVVTGCSSGFGDLISRTLATDGHQVFATMRDVDGKNAESAQKLQDWAAEAHLQLQVLELDVTSEASVRHAIDQALAAAGKIDVAVNNAGASAAGPLEAFSIEQMASLLDLNALGPMRISKAVLPGMRARRSGLIVWITSTLGRVLPGRGGLYPATKWAAEGLAESLRYQVAPFGVDVAILEPGSFPTPATWKSMPAADEAITADYAATTPPPTRQARPPVDGTYRSPDPQEVADAVQQLVDLPAGHRPLRTVVGPVFTDGVDDYNQAYEQVRAHLMQALQRPDQAITWTPQSAAPANR